MAEDVETWRNARKGLIYVATFDPLTKRRQSVAVRPDRTVSLTTQERQLNQDMCTSHDLDPFSNGSLVPVELVETAEDYEQITSNPNILDESDMEEILKLKTPSLKKRLGEITNTVAVERLLELATSEDNEANLTMAALKAIEDRLAELRPGNSPVVIEHDSI